MSNIELLLKRIKPCNMQKPFAFVSYSKQDKDKVYSTVCQLQDKGYNIWIDKELKKQVGVDWQNGAMKAIANSNCKVLLFFMSESSLVSAPVCAELCWTKSEKVRNNHRRKDLKILPINVSETWGYQGGSSQGIEDWMDEIGEKNSQVSLSKEDKLVLKEVLEEKYTSGNTAYENHGEILVHIQEKIFEPLGGSKITLTEYSDINTITLNMENTKTLDADDAEAAPAAEESAKVSEEKDELPAAEESLAVPEAETKTPAEEPVTVPEAETKTLPDAGGISYVLYGASCSGNQSDLMIMTFGKVLKKHPEIIDEAYHLFTCLSNIDYSDPENRTPDMPSYFRVCHSFEIDGKTVCIGTAYGFKDKLVLLAKLLVLAGEDKTVLQIKGHDLPEVKIRKGTDSNARAAAGGEVYYIFGERKENNQSAMMWDLFEALTKRYPEKIRELAVLSAVKPAEQVTDPGTKDAKPSYFRVCKEFAVEGQRILVGTSFAKDAKITQMKKMISICGAPEEALKFEGIETKEPASPARKRKEYII